MMTYPGLRARRRIDPSPSLRQYLETMGRIEEIDDKRGKTWSYIDDSLPFDHDEIVREIVTRATLGFVLFGPDNDIRYYTTSADKLSAALASVKVTFDTSLITDDMPEADPEPEEPDLPVRGKR